MIFNIKKKKKLLLEEKKNHKSSAGMCLHSLLYGSAYLYKRNSISNNKVPFIEVCGAMQKRENFISNNEVDDFRKISLERKECEGNGYAKNSSFF